MVQGFDVFTFPLRNFLLLRSQFIWKAVAVENPNRRCRFAYVCVLHTTKLTSVKNRANQKIRQNQKRTKGEIGVSEKWNTRDSQQQQQNEVENTAWTFYRHIISHASFILIATAPTNHSMLKNIVVRTVEKKTHNNMPLYGWNEHIHTTRTAKKLLFSLLSSHRSLAKMEKFCLIYC